MNHPVYDRPAFCPLGWLSRHEENAAPVEPSSRQFCHKFLPSNPLEQFVGEGCQHASAVSGIVLTATAATVFHVLQHAVGIVDDLTGTLTLDMGDETDAA